ncbi:MAG: hypothetical protein KC592_18875, partial [Nitrospira sp.]|nr:hypothetical protein [Nitrospira sp.]
NVRLIYLPNGNLQQKIGVDDYLSQGHTIADLVQLATTELKSLPPEKSKPFRSYQATEHGFDWYKKTREGSIRTPLTNFTAQIIADIVEDDGADTKRLFELEAQLEGKPHTFRIPVNQFSGMSWPIEHLGATALVYPGMGLRDHARAAIQIFSTTIERHTIYTHTGWRKVGEQWVFLHAGGAVGPDGPLSEIHVSLPTPLAGYVLPDPPSGDQLRSAIQASLRLLEVAPHTITYSLLAGTYRVVLGDTDFSFHLSGPTGAGKTELAALYQQHFGPGLDARHLPASWSSTGNALEGLTFVAKDVLMTVDDFAPTGSTADIQRYHREADRLFRAQGNHAGRQRMRADTSLQGSKFPRGAILSTGEDIPKGQSLRARVLFLEVGPDTMDFQKLSRCQNDAATGLYAQVMAAFIKWVAPQYEQIHHRLKLESTKLRDQITRESFHKRTPGNVANVCVGLRYFLTFAREIGAISAKQEEDMFQQGFTAIARAATEQIHLQMGSDPTNRFFALLNAALGSGKAHVAALSGDTPIRNENDEEWNAPSAFGWRLTSAGTRENARDEWHPQGDRIGWVEHKQLYLDPEASYGAVQKMGQTNGEALPMTSLTLRKRLKEKGLLRTEPSRHPHLTVRKQIEGRRRDVLCVALDSLGPQKMDQVDIRSESPPADRPDTKPWSTSQKKSEAQMDHENSFEINGVPKGGSDGPLSPNRGEDASHKQAEVSHRSPLLTEKVDQSVDPLWNSREEINLVD